MGVMVELPHTSWNRSGVLQYRRRVPDDVRPVLGRTEFIHSFKTKDTDRMALAYPAVHAKFEAMIAAARASALDADQLRTLAVLQKAGVVDEGAERFGPLRDGTAASRSHMRLVRQVIEDQKPETGWQANADEVKRLVLAMEGVGAPKVTLRDAANTYLKSLEASRNYRDRAKQVNLAVSYFQEHRREPDTAIEAISRKDTAAFRDALAKRGWTPSTVNKRLKTISAVINHAIREGNLAGVENPFAGVSVRDERDKRDLRDPLTVDEIATVAERLVGYNDEARLIWMLMAYTGARVSEVSGLDWADVRLTDKTPHIIIRENAHRTIKTVSSRREVPLVGAALDALTAWAEGRQQSGAVFPRYAQQRDGASSILLQAMKKAKVWQERRKVVHSLRHSHKDWMRRAAPAEMADRVHGHASGGVARNYGGDQLLDTLADYMTQAHARAGLDMVEFIHLGT